MNNLKIKAAIFDMDGTLVDSLSFWDVFWADMGEKYKGDKNFRPSEEDDKYVRTTTLRELGEFLYEKYGFGESVEDIIRGGEDYMRNFYIEKVSAKSGVTAFLDKLVRDGTKMCIASASQPNLILVALEHTGLSKYFDKIISCSDVGAGKNKPDVFFAAAEYLGEKPQDIWVFEDSLTAIETAAAAGFKTVAVYDKHNYGHQRMKEIATEYVAEGETLLKLEV